MVCLKPAYGFARYDSCVTQKVFVTAVSTVLALLLALDSYGKDKRPGVRAQLAELRKESGLTLAEVLSGIGTVDFAHRSFSGTKLPPPAGDAWHGMVSADGSEIAFAFHREGSGLGIAHSDGTMIAEYAEIVDLENYCWAPDKSKLVLRAKLVRPDTTRPHTMLFILDLASGTTREIDPQGKVSSQCWSPDGRRIVYFFGGSVYIYDTCVQELRETYARDKCHVVTGWGMDCLSRR